MRPSHIEIAKTSGRVYAQSVHAKLADGSVRHLIGKLRPANTGIIDLAPGIGYDDELEQIIGFLTSRGIQRSDIKVIWPGPTPEKLLEKKLTGDLANLRVRLGSDVAERDTKLSSYFVSTSTFRYVANDERHVIVGPKGAGKTAILNFMRQKNKSSIVITPEHYATDLLNSLANEKLADELNVYISTWKYSLLVEIMQSIVANQKHSPAVKKLRKYLQDNGLLADQNETIFERFLSYLKRFTKVSGGFGGGEVAFELSEENDPQGLFKMQDLLEMIPSIDAALRNNPLHIYIDELDQSWDNSSRSNNFLKALFTAAIQIRGYAGNLHIFIFIRSEIFDLLKKSMSQLDKFRTDTEEIRWTNADLKHMVSQRIKHSIGLTDNVPDKMIVDSLFVDLKGELRCNPFDYLLSRTTSRPREVIQICTLAIEAAERNLAHRVAAQYILQAEEQFSSWKLEHIVSENMYVRPKLELLIDHIRGISGILPSETLTEICMKFVLDMQSRPDCPMWISEIGGENDALQILYECEIIGVESSESMRERKDVVWRNFDFHFSRPQAKPHMSTQFLIHPSLWRALEVVSPA